MAGLRWLLVGGNGLVGGHLRRDLARTVCELQTTTRRGDPGTIALDLADPDAAARAVADARPDVLVIAAANAWVEGCERDPEGTRRVNVDAPAQIALSVPDALLVVFSSEYVFDGERGEYTEDDAVAPINEYGRQKVALEAVAHAHGPHLICRTSGVYGWTAARTSFVAQVVDRLRAGRRFAVAADQLITPTPASDLARAVVELAESGAQGTFHTAGPEILLRSEHARQIARVFGLDERLIDGVPTASQGLLAARPPRAGLLTKKMASILGHGLSLPEVALANLRGSETS